MAAKFRLHPSLPSALRALFLLLLCGAAALCLSGCGGPGSAQSSAPSSPDGSAGKNHQEPEQSLRGTVDDASMNTLILRAEDGTCYEFSTADAAFTTDESGLLLGSLVTVTYRGTLDPQQRVQGVEVLSVAVEAPPAAEAGGASSPGQPEGSAPSVEERAQALLDEMTLEEKVGQMFIARCPSQDAAQKAADYHLGGYILFGRDFKDKTREQIVQDIQSYQGAAEIPLFIGVDEEGGTVNRVSLNPALRAAPFLSPQDLYAQGGLDLIVSDTLEKCQLLRGLGINVNFAPVCDVSQDPDDFIYARAFGQDAGQTARYVSAVVEIMVQEHMGCVLKHFPGYGNNADTHTGIAYDQRPYETFQASDFLPFQAGIDSGAGMVLVSHNIVACMDGQAPASLSPAVHQILREELGFDGVIVTDDLVMDGIRDFVNDEQAAVLAVQAGNDLLCCTDFEIQLPAVLSSVERGEISVERIDQSVLRILTLKLELGILQ